MGNKAKSLITLLGLISGLLFAGTALAAPPCPEKAQELERVLQSVERSKLDFQCFSEGGCEWISKDLLQRSLICPDAVLEIGTEAYSKAVPTCIPKDIYDHKESLVESTYPMKVSGPIELYRLPLPKANAKDSFVLIFRGYRSTLNKIPFNATHVIGFDSKDCEIIFRTPYPFGYFDIRHPNDHHSNGFLMEINRELYLFIGREITDRYTNENITKQKIYLLYKYQNNFIKNEDLNKSKNLTVITVFDTL